MTIFTINYNEENDTYSFVENEKTLKSLNIPKNEFNVKVLKGLAIGLGMKIGMISNEENIKDNLINCIQKLIRLNAYTNDVAE